MRFSAVFSPVTLFSLKSSNATNSGAKSLFLPSPYAIKMAILNQAITIGGDLEKLSAKKSEEFAYIRDAIITYRLPVGTNFCVNNSFVKILKPAREGGGFQQTVAFREYIFISEHLELIFDVNNEDAANYLKQYLHKINYFGKKGCFFQFISYNDNPNDANVKIFNAEFAFSGIIEEFDDLDPSVDFENVNNFSSKSTKRKKDLFCIPLKNVGSSKSFTNYLVLK